MLVREIMTSPAVSVAANAPIEEAVALMADRRITALPVVSGGDLLVGILSEMDILRYAVPHDSRAHMRHVANDDADVPTTVSEIMTERPHSMTEGADVADVITLFTHSSVKSLPVVRGRHLVGVVSRSDIIRAVWRRDEDLQREVGDAFAEFGQGRWQVEVSHGIVTITGSGTARERDVATAIARSVMGVRRVRHAD